MCSFVLNIYKYAIKAVVSLAASITRPPSLGAKWLAAACHCHQVVIVHGNVAIPLWLTSL